MTLRETLRETIMHTPLKTLERLCATDPHLKRIIMREIHNARRRYRRRG